MTVRQGSYFSAQECSGGPQVATQRVQAYLLARHPGMTSGGIYNCRTIAGSSQLSVHATGRAGDTMTGVGRPTLASLFVAEQMRVFSQEMGIQGIIHNRRQWFCHKGAEWRTYTGQNPHTDHIHWERVTGSPLEASEVVALFQGVAPTGGHLFAGHIVSSTSRGAHVTYVQRRLNAHGFSLAADSVCGPKTVEAIRQFQGLAGLKVDGIAGPATQGRLQ